MDGEETLVRRLVEHFPDGFVVLFEDRDPITYTYAAGAGIEKIGLTKSQIEGRPVGDGRPSEIRDRLRSKYRSALDGEETTFEVDAEGRHFQITLFPIPDEDGTITTGAGIVQDRTQQQLYREQLEQYTEHLERVTRMVSHDVRNPLSVAMGRLDVLRRECESDQIDVIDEKLQRIESLIEDLLEEEYTIPDTDREEIRLRADATAAWQNVDTGDARLTFDTDAVIEADRQSLRRLFENLYRNAIEHGDGAVTVTVGPLDRGFYVADDGPGIPESERSDIFDHEYTTDDDGTGLGLFIVRQIVQKHGWRIAVRDSADGGARFEVRGVELA